MRCWPQFHLERWITGCAHNQLFSGYLLASFELAICSAPAVFGNSVWCSLRFRWCRCVYQRKNVECLCSRLMLVTREHAIFVKYRLQDNVVFCQVRKRSCPAKSLQPQLHLKILIAPHMEILITARKRFITVSKRDFVTGFVVHCRMANP